MITGIAWALLAAVAALAGSAPEVRRLPAPEATQGAAADERHVYAIANSTIAKYDKTTGERVAAWSGDPKTFPHLNACAAIGGELVCASSNYPATPMASTVEVFDPAAMTHKRTIPLGRGHGSLTWLDRRAGAWWACFANYDGKGGEAGRDHRFTTLVQYDDDWREIRTLRFPGAVLARFAPSSSSGGGFGPDGRLYVTGHDRKELYVLDLPDVGEVLIHRATITAPMPGQAIAWDPADPWVLWGIDRAGRALIAARVPHLPMTGAQP